MNIFNVHFYFYFIFLPVLIEVGNVLLEMRAVFSTSLVVKLLYFFLELFDVFALHDDLPYCLLFLSI